MICTPSTAFVKRTGLRPEVLEVAAPLWVRGRQAVPSRRHVRSHLQVGKQDRQATLRQSVCLRLLAHFDGQPRGCLLNQMQNARSSVRKDRDAVFRVWLHQIYPYDYEIVSKVRTFSIEYD